MQHLTKVTYEIKAEKNSFICFEEMHLDGIYNLATIRSLIKRRTEEKYFPHSFNNGLQLCNVSVHYFQSITEEEVKIILYIK